MSRQGLENYLPALCLGETPAVAAGICAAMLLSSVLDLVAALERYLPKHASEGCPRVTGKAQIGLVRLSWQTNSGFMNSGMCILTF